MNPDPDTKLITVRAKRCTQQNCVLTAVCGQTKNAWLTIDFLRFFQCHVMFWFVVLPLVKLSPTPTIGLSFNDTLFLFNQKPTCWGGGGRGGGGGQ